MKCQIFNSKEPLIVIVEDHAPLGFSLLVLVKIRSLLISSHHGPDHVSDPLWSHRPSVSSRLLSRSGFFCPLVSCGGKATRRSIRRDLLGTKLLNCPCGHFLSWRNREGLTRRSRSRGGSLVLDLNLGSKTTVKVIRKCMGGIKLLGHEIADIGG